MKKNRLVMALAGALLLPAATPVFAQSANSSNPAPTKGSTKQLQTIVVTGSAIPRVDVETPSPVTIISAKQIARSGYTSISDVVRSISADNSGSIPNAFTNGFAAGAAAVSLRGLTANSTLVLIDGHRSAAYPVADDGERSFVDLNTIPLAAVDRVEVLKDGASSLYGADAIAGVVNIILKKDYHGVEATADVGTSEHGGGFTRKASFIAGGGDLEKDHYNAFFSAEYQKDNSISLRDRGFPYNTNDLSSIGGDNNQGGQPGQNSGSIYGSVTPFNPTTGMATGLAQPLSACGSAGKATSDNSGSYCSQNFVSQYGQVQPAMEHGGLYSRFTVKLNDNTTAYMSASYFESKTSTVDSPAQIQSSTPNNTNNITLPAHLADGSLNPNDPFAASGQDALINYAFGDIPRGTDYDNHNARLVGDISGIAGDWNYDAALVINHTWLDTNQFGFLNYGGLVSAINKGTYSFINPSSNTSAERAAISPGYSKTSTSDLDSLDLSANRELWDLPGGPLGMALGVQFRHEADNDPTLNPGFATQGLGNAVTKGSRDVSGAYAEFDAPITSTFEADLSGRFDHYTDIGNGFTPKLGLKWQPLDWVALRGTYSRGIRAPNFAENGSSSSEGFVSYSVPDAVAAAHGSNGYTQVYQLAEFTRANPNIKPERATNYTLGIVLQPTSWLSGTVDYYHIKKTNVIVAQDQGATLAAYYAGQPLPAGSQVIADQPDPANPGLLARPAEVIGEYVNANSLTTQGVDVDAQAHFDFANGLRYITDLSGTDIISFREVLPDGSVESFSGTHGPYNLSSGAGTPRYRESWANTFMWGPATITGTFYHTSGMENTAADVYGAGVCIPDGYASCHVGSFTEFNLTGSYQINSHLSITGSVMNAFDRKAPIDVANYAAVNYNPTYAQDGVIGRFFNLGVKLKM